MLVVKEDTEKARLYAIMRRRATGLLAGFALLFVGMTVLVHLRPDFAPFWVRLGRATAETAMVGGLADWFAVTALFRHPLGIPIPHTAIIPQRKDQFGRTLGEVVQDNFLSPGPIVGRIRSGRVVGRAAEWLSHPDNATTIARHAADIVVGVTDTLR